MRVMRVVLSGYYGKGNGGDEALLASLLEMLPKQVAPVVLSGNPSETYERYGVSTCDRMSAFAVMKALRESDALIWGGGSLMQDTTSAISPMYYGGLMGLAQRLGLMTIAWAQGIGPLKRPLTRWVTHQCFTGCTAISVRDRASAQLLTDWHIPCTLAPDPVWALSPSPISGLWELPAPRVAVVLRPHPHLTIDRVRVLTRALIDFQKATQVCILLVPFQPVQDLALAQQIQLQLPGPSKILSISDPHQLRGIFQGVEMAIAMRYHGLIMAAASACRCFAISYDPKVSQLMNELDLPGWSLDQLPDDPNQISLAWLNHYANGDALLDGRIQAMIDRALLHRDLLAATFNG
jgi:polysaccharide pyruvyl transferase CsaB